MGGGSSTYDQLSKSPYFESRTWSEDKDKKGGIRLNRDAVNGNGAPALFIHGKLPTANFTSTWGPQFTMSIMTTPKPPPADVVYLWQRLFKLETFGEGEHTLMVGPWLTLAEFALLYRYLASVSTIDGDESAWTFVSQAVLPSKEEDWPSHFIRLGQVYGSSYILASVYASLCGRFGIRGQGLGVLTQDQWMVQKYMRPVKDVIDYTHVIDELITHLLPAPTYNLPSETMFHVGMQPFPIFSVPDLGWMQGFIISVFYHYIASYPTYEAEMNKPLRVVSGRYKEYVQLVNAHQGTWEKVSKHIVDDWKQLLGTELTYAKMREKWGKPKEIVSITSCSIVLKDRTPKSNFWQPSPTSQEIQDMKTFDDMFHGSSQNQLSTEWITKIGNFMARLEKKPTETGFNATQLRHQVENPATHTAGQIGFNQLCILYDGYVGYERHLTDNWKDVKNGEWDKSGHTEKDRGEIDNGGIDSAKKAQEQLREYPNPHLLSAEKYAVFLENYYPIPKLRPILAGEDGSEYKAKCDASTNGYINWARLVTENRAQTGPTGIPIGKDFPGSVDVHGNPTRVYNFYPDFGVWELPQVRTGWDKFLNFILNPYKSLYGKSLLEELMGQAKVIFNFMLECFQKASKGVFDVLKENALLILGFGAVAIIGVREVGNAIEKSK